MQVWINLSCKQVFITATIQMFIFQQRVGVET